MPEFIDSKGQTWDVRINGWTVLRVEDKLKVDLGDPLKCVGDPLKSDPSLLTQFDVNISFKINLLYWVCQPEAEKHGVSNIHEFAALLEGDALYNASEALTEAWLLFCRGLHRPELVAAIEVQREETRKIWLAAEEQVRGEALAQQLRDAREGLGNSSVSSQQSPAPTPAPGPSES